MSSDVNTTQLHSTKGGDVGTSPDNPHVLGFIPSDAVPVPGHPGVYHIGGQYYRKRK